jgi:hypothetical protein
MFERTFALLDIVLFLEFFHPARRVDDILLPGVKGMAVGANLNMKVLRGRFGLYLIAAGTFNDRVFVFGMYFRFHCKILGL